MRVFTTILLLLTLSFPVFAQSPCGDVTSITYQGYEYDIVEIGEQCWFAENLRNVYYANGDAIPEVTDNSAWEGLSTGARCDYDNDANNVGTYGRLYNWYAVDDARGLCPSGWHVPTDGEFMTLEMELGMSESDANDVNWRGTDQGTQMKSSPEDLPSWNGSNTSGFSGLAGGFRFDYGYFEYEGIAGDFWTSSNDETEAWYHALGINQAGVARTTYGLQFGFSVRCIKDTAIIQGCTIEQGCNYNPEAMEDDNSCVFIGDSCDDGDSETEDDVINANCYCAGTPVTSVSQLDVESLSVYPNPVSDQLTVELGSLQGTSVLVKIFDSQGKLVFDENRTGTFIIDVSTYNTGVYSIRVESESEVIKAQFIVE